MVALIATVERRGDASLVELVVDNETPDPRRVRVANRLDGPVWPPRSEGVPAAGWDDGGFEGIVGPGERLGLGYASPAEPADPPAEIAWSERAAECEPTSGSHSAASDDLDLEAADPDGVVRALGDPRPPRDVVVEPPDEESGGASPHDDAPPEAVEEWFGTVAARVERAEDLAAATSLLDAARCVERAGGLATVERLVEELEDDADALRAVQRRAAKLADRTEVAEEVPLSSFRRLS